jgi:uncharacterized phage protein (TIGR02218 family)
VFRMTTHPFNLIMSNATVYETDSGYEGTAYQSGTSSAPAAIDVEGFVGAFGITRAQILSGLFEGARVYIFKCDYINPVEDHEEITVGLFGKVTLIDDRLKLEGMSLDDALNQTVGITVTPACRHTLGDSGCGLTITPATGTVTHITSNAIFRDSSRAEAADWFAYGTLEFTSGDNAGLPPLDVKRYEADGTIELFESFYYPVTVGDTFDITVGCRKTLETCRDKFNNVVNPTSGGFGGFPSVPNSSEYAEIGRKR